MMMSYQRHCTEFNDDFEVLGWPRCAYTVSKVAVNAYTKILQRQLEAKGIVASSFLRIVHCAKIYYCVQRAR